MTKHGIDLAKRLLIFFLTRKTIINIGST